MNPETFNKACKLYSTGLSALQIKEKLNISITVRSIQRAFAKEGIIRPRQIAYDMAVKAGRLGAHRKKSKMKYIKYPPAFRYLIFKRDNFRCQICGATGKERLLEIDHKDFNPQNNNPQNLQILCEWCNKGRLKNLAS